jgi:signal transduction histidine kinase/CheY-like chemotaxis protein/HPt (histidine-containing phosphotransfer) domain-containing protein
MSDHETTAGAEAPPASPTASAAMSVVLILAADTTQGEAWAAALAPAGHATTVVGTDRGMQLTRALQPGLLLVDGALSDAEIERLRHALAQDQNTAAIPMLMITAPGHRHQQDAARHASLLQALPCGVILIRAADSRIVEVNEAFLTMTGYCWPDIIGRSGAEAGLWPEPAYQALAAQLRHNGTVCDQPLRLQGKNGAALDGKLNGETLRIDGEHHLLLVFVQAQPPTAAQDEARHRLVEARSAWLAGMSHGIRTPLNGMLGMAQIGVRETADPRARTLFQRIINAGRLLSAVLNDILDLASLDTGEMQVKLQPVDLHTCLDELCDRMQPAARDRQLTLQCDKQADLPVYCLIDPIRLQQILLNLLGNAIRTGTEGRITLEAGLSGSTLRFAVDAPGANLPADTRAHLFDTVPQDKTASRFDGDSGLGLAIAKQLVDLMHGDITAQNRSGGGCRIEVQLPYMAATPVVQTAARPQTVRRLQGMSVLVVEDSRINQMVLEDSLQAEGARVTLSDNGKDAIEQIERCDTGHFDVVLMDIQMPLMDGYEATRKIRLLRPELPVIGQTAHTLQEEYEKGRAAGMVEHIAKPIDLELLVDTLTRYNRRPRPTAEASSGADPDWQMLSARYAGRQDFLQRLLTAFLDSHTGLAERLRSAADTDDADTATGLAHGVKGMAGSVASEALRAQALVCEQTARQRSSGWQKETTRLADRLEALMAEIRRHLDA